MVHDDGAINNNPGQPDSRGRTDTCETCRFFEVWRHSRGDNTVWGFWHRYPPRAGNGLDADKYPRVEETNFCGEHQAAYGHGV